MDNINSIKAKNKYRKFALGFLGIIIVTAGGFFVWDKYFSPSAKYNRQLQRQSEAYMQWEERHKQAMKEDTYGGKTPEETLQMFIDALKKEDVELASKYFMLDTNEQPYNAENYLTRKKWENALMKTKDEGKLIEIINVLSKATPAGSVTEGYFGFEVRNNKNELIADISMQLNKYSNVWKIESM